MRSSETLNGIIVFADMDLQPNETDIDFSRNRFPPGKEKLGTISAE